MRSLRLAAVVILQRRVGIDLGHCLRGKPLRLRQLRGDIRWVLGLASIPTLTIAAYFWVRARTLGHDEAATFARGSSFAEGTRVLTYRIGAAVLLVVTIGLLVRAVA